VGRRRNLLVLQGDLSKMEYVEQQEEWEEPEKMRIKPAPH
jgi:hypothetical protein